MLWFGNDCFAIFSEPAAPTPPRRFIRYQNIVWIEPELTFVNFLLAKLYLSVKFRPGVVTRPSIENKTKSLKTTHAF